MVIKDINVECIQAEFPDFVYTDWIKTLIDISPATLAQLGERQTEVSQSKNLKALCSIHKSRIFIF